jgi:hypothetical protein
MVLLKTFPLFVACAFAAASYPAIPSDKSTPVQQRLAVKGPNGRPDLCNSNYARAKSDSCIYRMEHIPKARSALCSVRDFEHIFDLEAMLHKLNYIPHVAHLCQCGHSHRASPCYYLLLQDRIHEFFCRALPQPSYAW